MTTVPPRYAWSVAAGVLIALLLGLASTGKRLGLPALAPPPAAGIIAAAPAEIRSIEIRLGRDRLIFRRGTEGWTADRLAGAAVPRELASHLDAALRFMHVSMPARTLEPADYKGTALADFGLDPPAYVVALGAADRSLAVADFGMLNPAQSSQYVRVVGQPKLYLLPRHVGVEWQLAADMAERALPAAPAGQGDMQNAAAGALVPVSIDRIWAVEIVAGGKLHRFERDRAGSWFLHTGQHSHVGGTNAHIADPAKAPVIADALAAFGGTQIEALVSRQPRGSDLDRFGLSRPALIALLYARDSSAPVARIEIGNAAGDGFSRYAHLAQGGAVVTIAAYEAQHLTELLKAVGAAP